MADYNAANAIAITTYSALFNVNPFFKKNGCIILDDAHSAENYVASMWSVDVDAAEKRHEALHAALSGVVRPVLKKADFARLTGKWKDYSDASWIDKLPTPKLIELSDQIIAVLDEHADDAGLRHQWSAIRDHLEACHFYMSSRGFLIRPLIPPTWSHKPFADAGHRIYMSATLGAGGDLERLCGQSPIDRLPIPEGFESQGVGRRLFLFPGMSMLPGPVEDLRLQLMQRAGRSLSLVPSFAAAEQLSASTRSIMPASNIYTAEEIEESKHHFTESEPAAAIIANRYDGIDFPGNECRFLAVDGLPRAANLQERFIMVRMGASALFEDRVQTRALQAVGRCTRSLEDYSAVLITGTELLDYLADQNRWERFHPELQAELEFGVTQSSHVEPENFIEYLDIFLRNDEEWEAANADIVASKKEKRQRSLPTMKELEQAVDAEIEFQTALWNSDYSQALASAETVLGYLKDPDLRGYRALWHYLAASAALLAERSGERGLGNNSKAHFEKAKKAAPSLAWLVELSAYTNEPSANDEIDLDLIHQVEKFESGLLRIGALQDARFNAIEKSILERISSSSPEDSKKFESALVDLGRLLGFTAKNDEGDAAPDPWWVSKERCIVFEAHSGGDKNTVLGAKKARQVSGHPKWLKDNVKETSDLEFTAVLITPCERAEKGAIPQLEDVYLWPIDEFREWAKNALNIARERRAKLSDTGDLDWRAQTAETFEAECLSSASLVGTLRKKPAKTALQE
ncbi:MAG: helicase C-terminal domain-containing protein [Pseudomonadota bacterium]